MFAGRFAPSPSGDLHIGNLRTALLAWLYARASDRSFHLRIDDLDRVQPGAEERQLDDLAAIGLTWDGPVQRQSERLDVYAEAIADLTARGLTYECFCTRREIAEAASAPHAPPGAYPGTCRDLSQAEIEQRRAERPGALRLRADVAQMSIVDGLYGLVSGPVDDLVLRRNDGIPAYNLTTVVDDAALGVDQVVRGDDLLTSAPRQAHLAGLLGLPQVTYVHVPLAVNAEGRRLSKRDGAVTFADLIGRGVHPLIPIAESIGASSANPAAMLVEFDGLVLPREPWVFEPPEDAS